MVENVAEIVQKKIWGVSFGVIGDLIMGLPVLNYFEKKYPGSYKYWVIEKKCSICAPLYFNHPLIDRVKITDEWSGFGEEDRRLMDECDIVTYRPNAEIHDRKDWYNVRSCIEETARIAGIFDLKDVLSEDEMKPKLVKWFDVGLENPACHTYTRSNNTNLENFENNISIWPFSTEALNLGRSPSPAWWNKLITMLIKDGYTVCHYGRATEPRLSNLDGYINLTHLSYFRQLKACLASRLCIGTDSGSQWVVGAYSHPAINLVTNFLPNHHSNLLALDPINDNAVTFYENGGCDNISVDAVHENVKERVKI